MGTSAQLKDYVYVCITAHCWGEGKTENQAIRNCRRIARDNHCDGGDGNKWLAKYGYDIFYCHKDYKVNGWGQLFTAKEHPITRVCEVKPLSEIKAGVEARKRAALKAINDFVDEETKS